MVTRRYGVMDIDKFVEQYRPFTIGFEKVFDNLNTISDIKITIPPTTSSNKAKNSSSSKLLLLVFVRMSSTSMLYQRATNLLSKVYRIVEKIQKSIYIKVSVLGTLHGHSV